ncbi:MAG: hypothetical protein MZU97_11015 [Bacillus subtilis]|nr:hypothetical protein [Bacillus subtilis]
MIGILDGGIFKNNNDLKILAAIVDDEIVGIAPLYAKKISVFNLIKIKKLCFLAEEISTYLDFIIKENSDREAVSILCLITR